jgi:hypothetical protein
MPTTIRVTDALAQRHEALWLKLTALLAQGRDIAIKKPEAPVADEARIIAEGLLHDCAMFAPKGRHESLPVAGRQWGALAAQLGQAQAVLDAYEALWTGWDESRNYRVWLTKTRLKPVQRLLPQKQFPEQGRHSATELRRLLAERMDRAARGHFYRGYEAGKAAALRALREQVPVPHPREHENWPRIRQF